MDETIVSLLKQAMERLNEERRKNTGGAEAREFSIALTNVEDAIMRTNRAFSMIGDRFQVSDVEGDM